MITENPMRWTAQELPSDTLDRLQSMAVQLRALMDCASAFLNEPVRLDLVKALTDEASGIAREIDRLTDATNRPQPSRIFELFREYQAIRTRANAHVPTVTGAAVDEEMELLFWQKADQITAEIMALPCQTAADFAAKMIMDTDHGETIPDWKEAPIWQEARRLVGMPDVA